MQRADVAAPEAGDQLLLQPHQHPGAVEHGLQAELAQHHPPGPGVVGVGLQRHHPPRAQVGHQLLHRLLGHPQGPRHVGHPHPLRRLEVGQQPGVGVAEHGLPCLGVDPGHPQLVEALPAADEDVAQAAVLEVAEGGEVGHLVKDT